MGHHLKPKPTHTHPLATPQASSHRHRQHPQHPGAPRTTQHDAPDTPTGGTLPGSRPGRTSTTFPATPTARAPARAERTTANPPGGRAAQGRTQPDNPPNINPYNG